MLKNQINLIELCRKSLGLNLTHDNKTLCLWHHEKTPSMVVHENRVHCFGCGKTADHIELVQKLNTIDFKSACEILAGFAGSSYQGQLMASEVKSFPSPKPRAKSYAESLENEFYLAQIRCLKLLCTYLNCFTQGKISSRKIPSCFHTWFIERGFDIACLLNNYSNGNVLFLDDVSSIYAMRSDPTFLHEKSGLFKNDKHDQSLFWFSNEKYALVCPIYGIDFSKKETVITSLRIRNIRPQDEEEKEVLISLHESIRNKGFPTFWGYAGLDLAAKKYPQVIDNYCENLSVLLLEGIPDMLSAWFFYGEISNTIALTAGSPSTSSRQQDLELLKNCSELILIFDLDNAGYQGRFSVAEQARKVGIKTVKYLSLPAINGKNSDGHINKVDLNDCLKAYNKLNTANEKLEFFNNFVSLHNAQIVEHNTGVSTWK